MAGSYRKKKGSDTWHFCSNCSRWPTFDYDETTSYNGTGELCNECKAKRDAGDCK